MPYVSRGCPKSTQKRKVEKRGITSLIEGDIFLASISTHFFLCFFLFFLYFCVFCLFRRIPFKYGGMWPAFAGAFFGCFSKAD